MPKEGSVVLRSRRRHQYRHTRHNRSIIRRFLKTSIVLHTMKRIYHSRITIRHHFIELFHGITLGSAVVQWATWLTTLNCFATPPRRSSEQIARAACRLVAFYSSTILRRSSSSWSIVVGWMILSGLNGSVGSPSFLLCSSDTLLVDWSSFPSGVIKKCVDVDLVHTPAKISLSKVAHDLSCNKDVWDQ